jgi:hypothetical protein
MSMEKLVLQYYHLFFSWLDVLVIRRRETSVGKLIELRKILNEIEKFEWSDALFLPEDETWSLDTQGTVLDPDDVEDDGEEVPEFAREHDLMYALSIQTIQSIIKNASEQKKDCTDADFLEAFLHYYDHDAYIVI